MNRWHLLPVALVAGSCAQTTSSPDGAGSTLDVESPATESSPPEAESCTVEVTASTTVVVEVLPYSVNDRHGQVVLEVI